MPDCAIDVSPDELCGDPPDPQCGTCERLADKHACPECGQRICDACGIQCIVCGKRFHEGPCGFACRDDGEEREQWCFPCHRANLLDAGNWPAHGTDEQGSRWTWEGKEIDCAESQTKADAA